MTDVSIQTRMWHFTFSRWYDHDRAGHPRRARTWGRINDGLCKILDTIGWG
jgi:hypothetical protein